MHKTCFLNGIILFPRHFPATIMCAVLFGMSDLMGLSMQALKNQEWKEVLWRNIGYNAKFSVKTRLEHGFAIEYT